MKRAAWRGNWGAVIGLTLALLAGGVPLAQAAPGALEAVRLQLKWRHQFQFAGYYAAQAQGYYRDVGLEARLLEAEPGQDPVAAVLEGRAEFGVGTSELLSRWARGDPVVALAVIFQHSPQILLARRGPDLNHVHDLIGKRVMIEPGSADLLAYLRRERVPLDRLRLLPHEFNLQALLEDRADAVSAYATDEPFQAQAAGLETLVLTPRALGIDFYGDNLFTPRDQIADHPQRVRDFLAASLRGWRYALEHPEEIIELILSQYSQRHSREHLRHEAQRMRDLVAPALVELGYMNPGRWRHIADTLAEEGLLPTALDLEGFLYQPDPRLDLKPLYRGLGIALALLLAGGLTLFKFHRLNRKLRHEIQQRQGAEAKFRGLVEQSLVGIYIIQDNHFVYVNPRFAELFGYEVDDIIGRLGPMDLTAPADRDLVKAHMRRRLEGKVDGVQYGFTALRRDGALIDVEVNGKTVQYDGRPAIMGMLVDITAHNRAQRQLSYLAFYDPTTELPNRALFFDRLGQALAQIRRGGTPFALLMLDLDGFKAVNDTHGHHTGDALLREVGKRLRACVRESDTVARTGGDEFILLLQNLYATENAELMAGKVIRALGEPFSLDGHECRVGVSIGICVAPQDGDQMETLISRADAAMYQSKARGKNTHTRYQPGLGNDGPIKGAPLAPSLAWSEEIRVGIPVIDEQHAQLTALLNRVNEDLRAGQGMEVLGPHFDDLIAYTRYHFATEERLMEEYGYAGASQHQQAHRRLLDDLLSIRLQSDGASLILTLRTLKEWLVGHIMHGDRPLAEAILASGGPHADPMARPDVAPLETRADLP